MPALYDINCPNCGPVETFCKRMVSGPTAPCDTCGAEGTKAITGCQIDTDCFETPGIGGSGPFYSKQLSQEFSSKADYKKQLKARGMREISKSSMAGRKLRDFGRSAAARVASDWGEDSREGLQSLKKASPHKYAHMHDEQNFEAKRVQAENLKAAVESGAPKTLTAKDFA